MVSSLFMLIIKYIKLYTLFSVYLAQLNVKKKCLLFNIFVVRSKKMFNFVLKLLIIG